MPFPPAADSTGALPYHLVRGKDDDTGWFGTPEAAAYIGITQRTLYRLIDAGAVPAYEMGRVIRIKRSDLDAFLEASRVQPGELRHLNPPRSRPGAPTTSRPLTPMPCGLLEPGRSLAPPRTTSARAARVSPWPSATA